jgi:hypothetical protein
MGIRKEVKKIGFIYCQFLFTRKYWTFEGSPIAHRKSKIFSGYYIF